MNAAFGRGGDRIKPEQRPSRHDDLPSPRFGELDQLGPRQQRAG